MARPPRLNVVDGIYHITSRGVRRADIYEDELDYRRFRRTLAQAFKEHGWICHAFCQMPNHYHLVLETPAANLSLGMQRLNWRYAVRFNWRHAYKGHLFESRFYSGAIESNAHLLEVARYVVLNPVRAGLCRHPAEWAFSSFRDPLSARLMGQFGHEPELARERYEAFVLAGVDSSRVPVPGTRTRPNQPKPYVPAKRFASRRTRTAAGRPTTFR
ncbi:MAG TPA: transposase [Gaiellaceae bacterium]|jgi:REP element-mobilizing transposase RayT